MERAFRHLCTSAVVYGDSVCGWRWVGCDQDCCSVRSRDDDVRVEIKQRWERAQSCVEHSQQSREKVTQEMQKV